MRALICGIGCLLLTGCLNPKPAITLDRVPAAEINYARKAVLASTMEVRIDTSAVSKRHLELISVKKAMASLTVTEFRPETGKPVRPIVDTRFERSFGGGMRFTTVYASNSYRQAMWVEDHDEIRLDRRQVEPGWYTLYSYGSTAGSFEHPDAKRYRSCLQRNGGGTLAPGVKPIELKAGEIGYFGHFVFTIAMLPPKYSTSDFDLGVADLHIEPAPASLDELLREEGLDPARVRRVPAGYFPCPWLILEPKTS